jgi:hypothetical protein
VGCCPLTPAEYFSTCETVRGLPPPAPLLWVPSDIKYFLFWESLLSGNFHITITILGIFIFWESSFSASFQFLGVFNFNVVFWEYSILGIFILGIFIRRVFIAPKA